MVPVGTGREQWSEKDMRNHLDRKQEWNYLMGKLEALDEAYNTGKMTAGQVAGYRELQGLLKVILPVVQWLGFSTPLVLLDDA